MKLKKFNQKFPIMKGSITEFRVSIKDGKLTVFVAAEVEDKLIEKTFTSDWKKAYEGLYSEEFENLRATIELLSNDAFNYEYELEL